MGKEIIRTLGQINPKAAETRLLYNVPAGRSSILSSIVACNTSAIAATIEIAIFPKGITKAEGRSTNIVANKLIDNLAKFTETVQIGDTVQNFDSSPAGVANVVSVDTDKQLTLNLNAFSSTGQRYIVYQNPGLLNQHYIRYDFPLAAKSFHEVKLGISLSEFSQVLVLASTQDIGFSCFGVEITSDT